MPAAFAAFTAAFAALTASSRFFLSFFFSSFSSADLYSSRLPRPRPSGP
jgi:hypothetical protein